LCPLPQRDHRAIDAVAEQLHGSGMAEYARRHALALQRRAAILGASLVAGDQALDAIPAQGPPRLLGKAGAAGSAEHSRNQSERTATTS
jgi:hypothetical protein